MKILSSQVNSTLPGSVSQFWLRSTLEISYVAPAVFIDHERTLIEERACIRSVDETALIPGVRRSLANLNGSNFRTALIANQPASARSPRDKAEPKEYLNRLNTLLGAEGAYLDALYFYQHHSGACFSGQRGDLKIGCECRKPNRGLINQAQRDLNVDLSRSWMIGNSPTNLMTARLAGVRSILVNPCYADRDGKWPCLPDFECASFVSAVDLVLCLWPVLRCHASKLVSDLDPGAVVLVGGLARSGKSTWAASLASALKEQGRKAVVIPLDCWLRGQEDRSGPAVMDRYELKAAREFVVNAKAVPGTKIIPRYDRIGRNSIPCGTEIDVPAGAVLIVEGVPALADEGLRGLAAKSIYIERAEHDRLQEMIGNYRWRGWDERRIATLLFERGAEEIPFIEGTRKFADLILADFVNDRLSKTTSPSLGR